MSPNLTSAARILEVPVRNLSAIVVPLVWDREPDVDSGTRLRYRMDEMIDAIEKAKGLL